MDKRSIDIIIPTFDRKDFIEMLLDNIKDRAGFPHRVIVVLQPSDYDTAFFLENNKHLYDVLIETKERMYLSQALNLALNKVESEDFVVMNDDTLVGTDNWLDKLYTGYKNDNWFAMLPYIIPDQKHKLDLESLNNNIVRANGHWSSWCRIQNTKKVRDYGGFKLWLRHGGRDFEGGTFGNMAAYYKQLIGRHYGIKAIDLSVIWKYKIHEEIIQYFLNKGELPYEVMESSRRGDLKASRNSK